MGLLTRLLTAPVSLPVSGALWVAAKVSECAESELTDPATIRAALSALEEDLLAGRITEDDFELAEAELLARLARGRRD
ncbi:MAG: gas vesicle protein GvpG [Rhodobacteraceae bacterium]|jgi:hypothetical protein|nr:gas vesicle protein GvpG [Paracoccaceae bacterium]